MSDDERATRVTASLGSDRPARGMRLIGRDGLSALLITVAVAGCGGSDDPDGSARIIDGAAASASNFKKFDRQVASGRLASTQASGTVDDPGEILLSIKATPPQKAQMSWTLTCSKGSGAGSETGLRTLKTPVSLVLKQPMKDNDNCIVSANARLLGNGDIILKLASSPR